MDDPLITNGIGPEIEQAKGTVHAHRLAAKGWNAFLLTHGLRNPDGLSADRFDFGHAAGQELEHNRHAMGCAQCISGKCTRPAHDANDPTYLTFTWSAVTYANVDHMRGVVR